MRDSLGERARWSAYFTLDALKGGKVKERIDSDYEALRYGTSVQADEERVAALIAHASETTAFYAKYPKDTALADLPVVNKDTYRTYYEDFRSSKYRDAKDNRIMTTSGSTGTPFAMIQDHNKAVMNTADSIFLSSVGGYRIGEKIAFIRVWVDNVRKSRFQLFAENTIMMESSSLSDEAIAEMLDCIRREKVKCITGYSSALSEISRYIDRSSVDMSEFCVHAILPISEAMPDPVRERLASQFGCSVRSYYSNEENGIMGIESAANNSYYINSESYHFEILKLDSDEPASEGEVGRIVITDLNNYAFPILRYDNGDTAVFHRHESNGRFRLTLTELLGRRSDILYDTRGRAVTPFVITNNLWDVDGVKQYRFVQKGPKQYELVLNGNRDMMDIGNMIDRIRPALGEDAEIGVSFVEEMPVLASGKRKYIENLWDGGKKKNSGWTEP